MESENKVLCRIHLVHGTWGRGFFPRAIAKRPRWFEPGSPFRERFEAHLRRSEVQHELLVFPWSGSNSIVERDQAAKELAEGIREETKSSIKVCTVLIAHSHGGNVAFRALHHLNQPEGKVWVAAIATPFLQIRAVNFFNRDITFFLLAICLFVFFFNLLYLNVDAIAGITGLTFPLVPAETHLFWRLLASAPIAFIAFLMPLLLIRLINRIFGRDGSSNKAERIAAASYYNLNQHEYCQTLVVRGADDEASSALTIGGFGVYVLNLLVEKTILWLLAITIVLPQLFLLFRDIARAGRYHVPPYLVDILGVSAIYVTWCAAIYFGAVVAAQLLRCVFGRELLIASSRCEVVAHSTPDATHNMQILTLFGHEREGLRHSLYDDPRSADEIFSWLASSGALQPKL